MIYKIVVTKKAQKELDKLPARVADKIADEIEKLAENPRPNGYKKLTEFRIPHAPRDLYRIRIGDYRAVYSIEDNILTVQVFKVANRKEIYE